MDDWLRVQREKKKLQNETLQTELKFLKSQINPHFLFNTLNSLYALTLRKSDDAPMIVLRLSEMMRYMLYECNEKKVLLSKELKYLENYLELEKLRHSKNVDVVFNIEGEVENHMIAPLMFIPFVENGFKHGLNSSLQEGFIHIYIKIGEDYLNLEVKNSSGGKTMSSIEGKKSGGIGLVNVKRRLELLYPNKHDLKIREENGIYHVNMSLKLFKNKTKTLEYDQSTYS
jgi:LytS/YehU family sensor histidine kinase